MGNSWDPPEEWYGHKPVVKEIVTYECKDCGRELKKQRDGSFVHEPRMGHYVSDWDSNIWSKEQAKKKAEARKVTAKPYAGAIKQCQVGLLTRDRASIHYRCDKPAKFVSKDSNGEPMVVCGLHVKDDGPYRYSGPRWPPGPGAVEPVEPEYL